MVTASYCYTLPNKLLNFPTESEKTHQGCLEFWPIQGNIYTKGDNADSREQWDPLITRHGTNKRMVPWLFWNMYCKYWTFLNDWIQEIPWNWSIKYHFASWHILFVPWETLLISQLSLLQIAPKPPIPPAYTCLATRLPSLVNWKSASEASDSGKLLPACRKGVSSWLPRTHQDTGESSNQLIPSKSYEGCNIMRIVRLRTEANIVYPSFYAHWITWP